MMLSLSFLEPTKHMGTGQLLIQMKRSGWCALHREKHPVVEMIGCIARRALAYLALVGAAMGDLFIRLPILLSRHSLRYIFSRDTALELLQFVICSTAMPILGLGVWINALPNVRPISTYIESAEDAHDKFKMNPKMIRLTNQLLEPGSASSQLTISQLKERYPEIQDLEMHLMDWMLKNDLPDVVKRLIAKGLDRNIFIQERERGSRPALCVAIEEFNPDFVKMLLESGPPPDNVNLSPADYLMEILKTLYDWSYNISPLHEKISRICWHLMQHEISVTFPPNLTTQLENFRLPPLIPGIIRLEHELVYDQSQSMQESYDAVKREIETLQKKYKQEKKKIIQEAICDGDFPNVLADIITEYL